MINNAKINTLNKTPNLEIKDNVRFIFLALPGASLTGGGAGTNTSKELFEVNFITANFSYSIQIICNFFFYLFC